MKSSLKLWITLFSLLKCLQSYSQDSLPCIAITHVTIIDTKATNAKHALKKNQTVIIGLNRIFALGPFEKVVVPKNAEVINGTGKFLIPGLWDMHTHALGSISSELLFPLFIANGVTGIRDMGSSSSLQEIRELKQESLDNKFLSPRIVAAGKILDGPEPKDPSASLTIKNADDGRKAVQFLKQQGADFIKVYNGLGRDAYFSIAREAKKQGLSFAGHMPLSVSAIEASNAGQKSIEHMMGLREGFSDKEDSLREAVIKFAEQFHNYRRFLLSANAVDNFNQQKADQLVHVLHKNQTWLCPTLVVQFYGCHSDDSSSVHSHDSLLKYINNEMKEEWKTAERNRKKDYQESYSKLKLMWQQDMRMIEQMKRSGIPFLAGTDAVALLYLYPGFSLHDELSLFHKAGFTPLEALQTATINPAKFLGREKELGSIEKGKLADLVLLNENPLENISNTQTINSVILNGKLLKRPDLDQFLLKVEEQAKK